MKGSSMSLGSVFAVALLVASIATLAGADVVGQPKPAAAAPAATAAARRNWSSAGATWLWCPAAATATRPARSTARPTSTRRLSGSELGWKGPWGVSFARNLTPDMETGLGYWSEEEIVKAIRSGVRNDGSMILPPMPWQSFAGLTDQDAHAIAAYLMSLPPVKHKVPDTVPPGKPYAGALLEFPPPPAWDAPRAAGAAGGARNEVAGSHSRARPEAILPAARGVTGRAAALAWLRLTRPAPLPTVPRLMSRTPRAAARPRSRRARCAACSRPRAARARSWRWTASTCASSAARSSGCSGRTAPARPPASRSSPRCCCPTSGEARVAGLRRGARGAREVRRRISLVSGGETSGYGILTVRECLWMFSQFYGVPGREAWPRDRPPDRRRRAARAGRHAHQPAVHRRSASA